MTEPADDIRSIRAEIDRIAASNPPVTSLNYDVMKALRDLIVRLGGGFFTLPGEVEPANRKWDPPAGPCPGCGCEPEVKAYLRDSMTKEQRGYVCACGATVVDGYLTGVQHGR